MDFEVEIKDSFELPSDEEWDKYLGTQQFDALRIDMLKFDKYKDRIFLYPLIEQVVNTQDNKVGSMLITYSLCRHYYDKGIPDDPWYIDDGGKIKYMPNFKEEHWMRRYWFNHFAESMYLKYFSIWDSISDLLDVFFGLHIEHNSGFKYNVLRRLKHDRPDVAVFMEKIIDEPIYKMAEDFRNCFTHGSSPSDVSNGYKLETGKMVDVFVTDENGNLLLDEQNRPKTEKKKATVLTCSVGDYTNVKTIMENIDCFAVFSGKKVSELINMITT